MHATERLSSEIEFHDRQAGDRATTFQERPNALFLDDDVYLDHESWIRPAFEELGDLQDRRVLDFGCGHGMAAIVLARRGARVTAFDLSHGYVQEAAARAAVNGVASRVVQADGQRLPFADNSFDRIWGNAVLHHLDLEIAGRELLRVLSPSGIAVFCEPWGENPLLNWARKRLPYPGKERTPDEEPLRWPQVQVLRAIFPQVQVRGFQLLSMARRVLPRGRLTAGLDWCDDMLLNRVPKLRQFCRYVVVTLRS